MKIALVIPTRGIIFARTIQSTILSPELPQSSPVIIVSGLPIPDSHNECIRRALQTDCTYIWFIEEDMEIPKGVLTQMIAYANQGFEYVAVDYPVTEQTITTIFIDNNKPIWTGFGCTLFSRRIFEELGVFPLTSEYTVFIDKMHPFTYRVKHEPERKDKVYGQFDIWFGLQLRDKNVPIKVVPNIKCRHLRMRSWERKMVNDGAHEIYEL